MMNIKKLQELAGHFSILYVEDDKSIRESMSEYLKKFFKSVTIASNGLEGLESYKEHQQDIVITDLSMPHMNGIEMLKFIREINDEQAVLVTSAHAETDYLMSAIKAGIDGYIIKPFDYKQLNHELLHIVIRLQKYEESRLYKKHLENLLDKNNLLLTDSLRYQNENYEQTLFSLVEMIEERDTYTAGHSKRVAEYSQMIAQEMGYSKEDCLKIYQAAMLHDIGKIATPDAVLLNPKKLNQIEYKLIQEHVKVSYKLLNSVPMFVSLAEIVYSHHEHYDGSGYPRGLKADEIEPLARIMIVADAFDAMTTNRIYKARKDIPQALVELKELSAKHFHPEVVVAALNTLKNVEIEENITQLPITELEQERFAYFYKDELTSIYNNNYLEMMLVKNSYTHEYKYLFAVFLRHFSDFNKIHSWKEGDEVLRSVASILKNFFANSLVFRAFGDDFVVLCKKEKDLSELRVELDKLCLGNRLDYTIKSVDLEKVTINSVDAIEYI